MPLDALELTYATGLTVERHVPVAPYTSLKIGGPADYFVRARGADELARCLTAAHRLRVPWLLLGGGSNVLVSDRGVRGLLIKVERPPSQRNRGTVLDETATDVHLRCDAGVNTAGLARWTTGLGWTGLEWACGIPGTIGGAAAGNAGAYGRCMADCVERVRAWFPAEERVLTVADMRYEYRTSAFKRSPEPKAILSLDLRLAQGDREEGLRQIERNEQQRRERQPTERSCGSVFKNPYPHVAGQLIDSAGLKGTAVGDARISEKHGNFFVNRGRATAADVMALMRIAQRRVEEVHGLRLEPEIVMVGDWTPEELAAL